MSFLYALAFLYTQPFVADLGDSKWAVREAQSTRLHNAGLFGDAVALVHRKHPDPEISARCRVVLGESVQLLNVCNYGVGVIAVLWPDDYASGDRTIRWDFPENIEKFVCDWILDHPVSFSQCWGTPLTQFSFPVKYTLLDIRNNIRPWRNWYVPSVE